MTYFLLGLAAVSGLYALTMADASAADADDRPTVVLETTSGPITVQLDPAKAPITVENFLKYVDAGFYNGTIFHRVIPGFMIQGGGMDEAMQEKPTRGPIKNEASNGLTNQRGTIAMARTGDPNSATAQFFINLVDNSRNLGPGGVDPFGYTVFGKVVDGMNVVDEIAKVPTGRKGPHGDVPQKTITITAVKRKPKS
jgi:peptidyl-prolyl cis-trans isomerase A (cyclophilin A)